MTDAKREAEQVAMNLLVSEDLEISDVVEALAQYADAQVKEDRDQRTADDLYKRSRQLGWEEGLEEAAKVAMEWIWIDRGVPMPVSNNFRKALAEKIRALKSGKA